MSGTERESRAESSSHHVNQQEEVVKVSDVGGDGFTFSLSLALQFRGSLGFFRRPLALRASRSSAERVQISTDKKEAGDCPREAGVTRSKEVGGGGA